jgi:DNA-binding LacI/PurR family transcriptional regulator
MRDVAAAAGVSTALVSIVLRGAPGASAETRAKVFATAEQLGYRTNRTASLMKLRRTKHLGLTMHVRNAFHAELVEGIQSAADDAGYEIVLAIITGSQTEQRAVDTLLAFRCESLILLGSELSATQLRDLAQQVPVVLIGRRATLDGVSVVRSADHRGQALLVDHLADLGHRDITHVDGGNHPIAADRRRGYRTAMRRRGLSSYIRVLTGGQTEGDGRRAAAELMRLNQLPTAVCAFNDHCALGLIDALTRAGMHIPGECSVTGYDNSPVAGLAAIDLTSVSQEAAELARSAVRAAIIRLEEPVQDRAETVLEPRLVPRSTTGHPTAAEPPQPSSR